MARSISVRGRLVAGLLTLTACATAPVTSPPPTLAPVQKESPEVVVKAAPAPTEKEQVAFGFSKGMTLEEANAAAPLRLLPGNPNAFATRNPPLPFGDFAEVVVVISPTVGLCRIMASTPAAKPPQSSKQLAAVMVLLTQRFGASDTEFKQDASVVAVWSDPFGETSAVMVSLSKDAGGALVVVADYYFTNYLACLAEEVGGK
jgi:SpoU rRNA methylase family enzyme